MYIWQNFVEVRVIELRNEVVSCSYDLELELIRLDFKSGLVELQKKRPMKAVFLGTRIGDPNAVCLISTIWMHTELKVLSTDFWQTMRLNCSLFLS